MWTRHVGGVGGVVLSSGRGLSFFTSLPAAHQLVRVHAGTVSEPSIFQRTKKHHHKEEQTGRKY